jgi:hypothetical protein
MILRADFGWVIFAAFVLWLLQVLRAGGRSGRRETGASRTPSSGPLAGTQREGAELEELLRHLEGRLGQTGTTQSEARPKVPAKRPPPTRPAAPAADEVRAESPVDRAAVEARIRAASGATARTTAAAKLHPRQLRDAVVWQEVLGPPRGMDW